ncbi:hypothetical protein AVEN_70896-1 [Araneus ventricosus]|uniref:Uncharacterized protein n=1 Tax=Araneus ventricosus TaxID=182803 RepID=A0A4Y2PMJ3_ARAVE|nr:hypothetical protein AVEN_17276-1 [Araneus ventricosus]GBN52339.1 hypothetical protein AVEN_70896-1 [Araneus ventricosus]
MVHNHFLQQWASRLVADRRFSNRFSCCYGIKHGDMGRRSVSALCGDLPIISAPATLFNQKKRTLVISRCSLTVNTAGDVATSTERKGMAL